MTIYVERVSGTYTDHCTPPTARVDYRCGELLSRTDLTAEFVKRGVSLEEIDRAFEIADLEATS
jgi:hypothetical protein